jgi:uncharacterized protein (TIGR02452 family)
VLHRGEELADELLGALERRDEGGGDAHGFEHRPSTLDNGLRQTRAFRLVSPLVGGKFLKMHEQSPRMTDERAEEARMALVVEGHATLEAIARGAYVAPSGRAVSIREAVDAAVRGTTLVRPDEIAALEAAISSVPSRTGRPTIEVTPETTSAAARRLVEREGATQVAALSFASAISVCGGFLVGAKAQEEDLARQSALYACLAPQRAYYEMNRALGSDLYTDAMIHSPDDPFFRDDGLGWLEAPYAVSILTVPAPACRGGLDPSDPRVHETIGRRARNILLLAAARGHRTIVLGAWGCGAFRNDPENVSSAFSAALDDERLRGVFERVLFAVYDPGGRNLAAFRRRFAAA